MAFLDLNWAIFFLFFFGFKTILAFSCQIPYDACNQSHLQDLLLYLILVLFLVRATQEAEFEIFERLTVLLELWVKPWSKQGWVAWEVQCPCNEGQPSPQAGRSGAGTALQSHVKMKQRTRRPSLLYTLAANKGTSGEKVLRFLQPKAVPEKRLTVSPSAGNSSGKWGESAWPWRGNHSL